MLGLAIWILKCSFSLSNNYFNHLFLAVFGGLQVRRVITLLNMTHYNVLGLFKVTESLDLLMLLSSVITSLQGSLGTFNAIRTIVVLSSNIVVGHIALLLIEKCLDVAIFVVVPTL